MLHLLPPCPQKEKLGRCPKAAGAGPLVGSAARGSPLRCLWGHQQSTKPRGTWGAHLSQPGCPGPPREDPRRDLSVWSVGGKGPPLPVYVVVIQRPDNQELRGRGGGRPAQAQSRPALPSLFCSAWSLSGTSSQTHPEITLSELSALPSVGSPC